MNTNKCYWDSIKMNIRNCQLNRALIRDKKIYEKVKNNKKYYNIHKGERCFILGNGPSLKIQDLSFLKNEVLFTVNQFYRTEFSKDIDSAYHFWADPTFFDNSNPNNKEIVSLIKAANKNTVTFFESVAFDYVNNMRIDEDIDCSFFKAGIPVYDNVYIDFTKTVSGCATVVQYAIEMAIFMGFSEIYLLGCDMTGIITTIEAKENKILSGGYSYTLSEVEKERIKTLSSEVSMESQFLGWGRMFAGYRTLNDYCQKRGIILANATLGGVLDNIPRVDLMSLF